VASSSDFDCDVEAQGRAGGSRAGGSRAGSSRAAGREAGGNKGAPGEPAPSNTDSQYMAGPPLPAAEQVKGAGAGAAGAGEYPLPVLLCGRAANTKFSLAKAPQKTLKKRALPAFWQGELVV